MGWGGWGTGCVGALPDDRQAGRQASRLGGAARHGEELCTCAATGDGGGASTSHAEVPDRLLCPAARLPGCPPMHARRRFADGFPNLFVKDAVHIRNRHVAFLASFHSPGAWRGRVG